MKRPLVVLMALLVLLSGCLQAPVESDSFRLGTTTSMRDSGLLDVLIEDFTGLHDIDVEYVAVGTGAALELGRNGDVDALIVHAPEQEAAFVLAGHANERTPIARNAFVLLGPQAWNGSVFDAFTSILENETCFVSRGDNSGTHAKEQAIWMHINQTQGTPMVEDSNGYHPDGDWYFSIGQGMGAAVNMADEKGCATFSDRGTALQFQSTIDLKRTEFDDPIVDNPYAYLIIQPGNATAAHTFASYLLTTGRDLIANYTINGDYPFFVD